MLKTLRSGVALAALAVSVASAQAQTIPGVAGYPVQTWTSGAGLSSSGYLITNGGSGYAVGDTIALYCGFTFPTLPVVTVRSVSGGGAVTAISVTNAGITGWASPLVDCKQNTTSGSGTGFVLRGQLGTLAAGILSASGAGQLAAAGANSDITSLVQLPNLAALYAFPTAGLIDNSAVQLTGGASTGDGGGGTYFWSSTSTATDDGGMVILPTNLVGSGRWLRKTNETTIPIQVWGGVSGALSTSALTNACAYSISHHATIFVRSTIYTDKQTISGGTCSLEGVSNLISTIYKVSKNVVAAQAAGGSVAAGTYYIRVYALDGGGAVLSVLPYYTGLSVDGTAHGTAVISWPAVTGAVTYRVYFDPTLNGLPPAAPSHFVDVSAPTLTATIAANPSAGATAPDWIDPVFEIANVPSSHLNLSNIQINGNGVSSRAVHFDDVASGYNDTGIFINSQIGGGVLGALYKGTFRYLFYSTQTIYTGGVNPVVFNGGADDRSVGDDITAGSGTNLKLMGGVHSDNFMSTHIFQGNNGLYTDPTGGQNEFDNAHIDGNLGTGVNINGKSDRLLFPTFVGNCSVGSSGCYDFYTNAGNITVTHPAFLRSTTASFFPSYNMYFDAGYTCPANISGFQTSYSGSAPYATAATNNLSCIAQSSVVSQLMSGSSGNSDLTGRVTLSGGAYTQALTGSYATAPNCITQDVTTPANFSWAAEGTASIVIHGTGTDVIKYQCVGTN